MPTARQKLGIAVEAAAPIVERLARDRELHEHVRKAYESATKLYGELATGTASKKEAARRVATDRHVQEELRHAIAELRIAADRARAGARRSHRLRNRTLLLAGIAAGLLYNPVTGPGTRRWLKDKLFGPEEPFEYSTNGDV
jgi:hypothetical protein